MVGEESASKSGKFTFLNCFDMGSGSLACGAKEGVKLYVYNLRSAHVERVRQVAIEKALAEAITEGLSPADAAKQAQKIGAKAAKSATRQAKRIVGPIISSGWDFFEAIYFGGSMVEGALRGAGTLFGTYMGGYHGEQRMGKVGYLMGSHFGSWIGARIGLMVYDVGNGVHYLVNFVQPEDESYESQSNREYITEEETDENNEHQSDNLYRREDTDENSESESGNLYRREDTGENSEAQSDDLYRREDTDKNYESHSDDQYRGEERDEESRYYQTRDEEMKESEGFSLF